MTSAEAYTSWWRSGAQRRRTAHASMSHGRSLSGGETTGYALSDDWRELLDLSLSQRLITDTVLAPDLAATVVVVELESIDSQRTAHPHGRDVNRAFCAAVFA